MNLPQGQGERENLGLMSRVLIRLRWPLALLSLVILVASSWYASSLSLRSDFSELLPQHFPSVIALKQILQKLGGVGNLIVVVEGDNIESNKAFVEKLAEQLKSKAGGEYRWLDYKNTEIEGFYKDHFLHYLEVNELREIHQRIKDRIDYEEQHQLPLYVDLLEDAPPSLNFEDIRERHKGQATGPLNTVDGYYGTDDGRMLLMLVRPKGDSLDVDGSRALVARVKEIARSLHPELLKPPVTVGYCGVVVSTVEEYDILKKDILSTALLCLTLVGLVIILYFRSIRDLVLLTLAVLVGVAATFAITKGVIGYLTSQTAFLGSLIVGTGVNYGIILMARYAEERSQQKSPGEAMDGALRGTWQATFLAAASTAVAFATLGFARNRGFSQFGFIGSVGIMLCWFCSIIFLPPYLLLTERLPKISLVLGRLKNLHPLEQSLMKTASLVMRTPKKILWVSGGVMLIAAIQIIRFAPNALEYDFTQLRSRSSINSGTEALENRVSDVFHKSLTPAVVLVEDPQDEALLCPTLEAQEAYLPQHRRIMSSCDTIQSLLPTHQEEKLFMISNIGKTLSSKKLRLAPTDVREKIDEVRRAARAVVITLADIPATITRYFEDVHGQRGGIAYISPNGAMPLSDGRHLVRFADLIREIRLPNGHVLHGSGEKAILADLIRAIQYDAPRLMLASLVGIFLLIFFTSRNLKSSAVILGGLLVGILVMIGIQATLPIRINFFNFIAIPLTMGIGVDYGLNIYLRLKREGMEHVDAVLSQTGSAVILCSLTTIISYVTLIIADSQVLASFGKLAIIGEITCIAAAIFFVPALGLVLSRHKG